MPTNNQGNHYCSKSGEANKSSYHYSNTNGSYYYKNSNGSTYHSAQSGKLTYTPPLKKP